jgi:PAS domain S-box-containing protein
LWALSVTWGDAAGGIAFYRRELVSDDRKIRPELLAELERLRARVAELEGGAGPAGALPDELTTVRVPEGIRGTFLKAQEHVRRYFQDMSRDPQHGTVEFSGERYIMIRAASMSVEFFELVASLYRDRGEEAARAVANGFLFDIAHALGKADARAFHQRMGVSDPLEKLSAGPIHFAYSGWARVDILPESKPTPDENFYLIYDHPYSFEVDAWLKREKEVGFPVCVMSAGYSSGWCEESFGIALVAVEVECLARGDEHCRFIMAPPLKIEAHLVRYGAEVTSSLPAERGPEIPEFFQRKRLEEALRKSEENNRLRAEIWKLAADESLSESALIQNLLESVGPALGVSRASFNRVEGDEVHCVIEWCAPEVSATLGTRGPRAMAEQLTTGEITVVTRESALARFPAEMREEAESFIDAMISAQQIESLLIVPCNIAGTVEGYVTMDVCIGNPRSSEWSAGEQAVIADAVQVISQIIARRRAESALREAKNELEHRVVERTAELSRELQERTKAEEALRESETRFRTLFESAAIGIAIASPEMRMMQANEAFRTMLGYSLAEIRTMTFLELTYSEDREHTHQLINEVLEGQRDSYHVEKRFLRKDGSYLWANMAASAVRDAYGRVQYWLGAVEDITVRRMAQDELEERHAELTRANRELERLHRAKDEFVAMVSHELRTPLVTGLGYIELLLEGHLGPVSEETTAGMQVALRNLRRLAALIDDILSYSSLIRRDRRSGPVLAAVSPAELLRECREEFLVRSGRDGSRTRLDIPSEVPSVYADEDMIRRVVANLLDNAHRHAGDAAVIALVARPEGEDRVELSVADNGPGMTPETQARVFEPFVKLSGKRDGAGLGLAIVRSVLEAHGSQPTLRSAPGKGTEIAFTLTVAEQPASRGRRQEKRRAEAEPARVLVVDDDEDTLEMVRVALAGHNVSVETVTSAEDAVPLLQSESFELVLLDMSLPGMDGADLCALVKTRAGTAGPRVLMFSARAEEVDRERARRAGCDGYITKPLVIKDFIATVEKSLGRDN